MPKRKATAEQIEKRRFWKTHIDAWKSSKLNQSQYCRQHQLKPHCFIYWKNKLSAAKAPASLVEVPFPRIFPPSNNRASALKVAVGEKYKIEITPGFDPSTLKEVILTLGRL